MGAISVSKEDDVGEWIQDNLPALLLVAVGIAVAVFLTIRTMSRRRNLDRGLEKGTAADPEKVKRQNPPD